MNNRKLPYVYSLDFKTLFEKIGCKDRLNLKSMIFLACWLAQGKFVIHETKILKVRTVSFFYISTTHMSKRYYQFVVISELQIMINFKAYDMS